MKFAQLILQQMHARLLEGEQKVSDKKKVSNWVPQEAVELRYIPNYGTFSEALVRCVEEKVCPILGDLVYELDFNNNLMLIANSVQFIDLWLNLFEALVCTPSRNDVNDDSKFPKRIENCQFPFSQHIMVIMDDMIKENHQPGKNFLFTKYNTLKEVLCRLKHRLLEIKPLKQCGLCFCLLLTYGSVSK